MISISAKHEAEVYYILWEDVSQHSENYHNEKCFRVGCDSAKIFEVQTIPVIHSWNWWFTYKGKLLLKK